MPPPEIHLATNADGPRIGELIQAAGFDVIGLDWSMVAPYWLVANIGNEIIGCLQVCLGRPVGQLENLVMDDSLSHREKAMTVKLLLETGYETLRLGGAEVATALVPFEYKSYKRLLKKRGAVVVESGHRMAMML